MTRQKCEICNHDLHHAGQKDLGAEYDNHTVQVFECSNPYCPKYKEPITI